MRGDMLEVTRLMSALVAAATIAACCGDDDSVTQPTPAISIALTNYSTTAGSGAAGATVGTSGGPSKRECIYYGGAASKQTVGR